MKVFISYRRQDNMYLPALVRDEFVVRLGADNVFFDVDSIPVGVEFPEYIRSWVARSDVLLALIGPNWRADLLADEGDFVRLELASARALDKMIVPVLHGRASMPDLHDVPNELAWLLYRNAFVVRPPPDHVQDMERLVDEVVEVAAAAGEGDDPLLNDDETATSKVRRASLDFISEPDHSSVVRRTFRRLFGG